jgi:hypothetical protein
MRKNKSPVMQSIWKPNVFLGNLVNQGWQAIWPMQEAAPKPVVFHSVLMYWLIKQDRLKKPLFLWMPGNKWDTEPEAMIAIL